MNNTIVNIYHDPSTELDLEGKAELLEFVTEDTLFRFYKVRFLVDNYVTTRKIRKLNFLELGD